MKFTVDKSLFEVLDTLCFAVVVAENVDNHQLNQKIEALLNQNIKACESSLAGQKVKETSYVLPYREAFRILNINPNKFMCSIEALLTRINKGKGMPHINSLVDLGNAVSLKYKLPIGAHDIDSMADDNGDKEISVRYSKAGDTFRPFGQAEREEVDENEVVYASGNSVRTRRWTWRQSEEGKITEDTQNIFFPIDGFSDFNKAEMLAAQSELAETLAKELGCQVKTGWVDKEQPSLEIN